MHLIIASSVLLDFFVAMPSRMLSDQAGGEVDIVSTQSPPSSRHPGNRKSSS